MDTTGTGIEMTAECSSEIGDYDVAIVGAAAAGLSAALTLGRALRRVIVIDGGAPRNAPAAQMHGFLGHDGLPPLDFLKRGRAEVAAYGVTVVDGEVKSVASEPGSSVMSFQLTLADGTRMSARRLLIASGARDVLPDIPGLKEAWGADVHMCPYCHGYEVRNQPLGVIATGDHAVPYTHLIRNWSSDVILFVHDHAPFGDDELEQLDAMGIRTVSGRIGRLIIESGGLQAVEMESGDRIARSAVFLSSYLTANTELLEALGAEVAQTAQGPVVIVDPQNRTTVPGVWAAGNVTSAATQVVTAAAAGNMAGGSINMDLIHEDVRMRVGSLRRSKEDGAGTQSPALIGTATHP